MPQDFISRPPYNVMQPGAYSAVDASQLASPAGRVGAPIPALVGVAYGGQPDVPLYFRSAGQLKQVLRSGPLYDACRFAFDGGAQQVCAVRIGNTVSQGSLALAGTGTVVTLTSLDWGSWTNSIQVAVALGPIITITYTDALGNTYTETYNLSTVGTLTPAMVAQAINGQLYGFNASNFVSATAGSGTLPLTTTAATPLAGGSDGAAPAAGDWTTGLQALETESVDLVLVATGDATIHAQAQTHCQNMSLPNARKERVGIYGGLLGETVAYQTGTRMPSLRSARSALIYPGIQDYNASGQLTSYDPFYAAAKVAGMVCALPDVATSLVHAQVPAAGVEVKLSTIQGGAIDQLLQAGVTPIAPSPRGGYWLVDSLTGYNQADQTFRDFHKPRSADYVAQYARALLEQQFIGSKILSSTQNAIQQAANRLMSDLRRMGVIASYKTAVVTQGPNINSWNVGLPVMLVDATKFIFITVQLQPSAVVSNTASVTSNDAQA